MYENEQFEALEKAKSYFAKMRFQAPPTDEMKKEGKVHKFGIKPFQTGALITISAMKQLHMLLKEEFQIPTLMTYYLSQDELERKFGEIRRLGSQFNSHPSALEYEQRLCQSVTLQLLEDETFDIFALQQRLKAKRIQNNDAQFSVTIEQLPEPNFNDLELKGIQDVASKVMSRYSVGSEFATDMKTMYNFFQFVHPKDDVQDKTNLLTGM